VKQIKAYVRPELLEPIVEALEAAGAKDMTVIRVDAIGAMAGVEEDLAHVLRKYAEKYSRVAKLEIVCRDEQADGFARIIESNGRLGESGDGRIFVAPVESAVDIRTGRRGDDAL
jgi:nitrogen regulatory protein P-II 1